MSASFPTELKKSVPLYVPCWLLTGGSHYVDSGIKFTRLLPLSQEAIWGHDVTATDKSVEVSFSKTSGLGENWL